MGGGLFVSGTDTGVGKTLVACGLAYALRRSGWSVGVMKPVETGCEVREGQLFPQDASYLREAAGSGEPLDRICPYRLPLPLAPSVAAKEAGVTIDLALLQRHYDELKRSHELTLVEGAGGLLVPLGAQSTFVDLVRLLRLPLLVVVANRLGALNHALLTLEHASCLGLEVLGYVLNHVESQRSPAARTNAGALRSLTSVPCLGEIPYLPATPHDGSPPESQLSRLQSLFEKNINLDPLRSVLPSRQDRS